MHHQNTFAQRLCVGWRMKRRNKQGGGYARWKARRGSAYVRVFQTLLCFPHQPSHSSAIFQSEVTAVPQEAFLRVQNHPLVLSSPFWGIDIDPGPKTHLNCGGQAVVDSPKSVSNEPPADRSRITNLTLLYQTFKNLQRLQSQWVFGKFS